MKVAHCIVGTLYETNIYTTVQHKQPIHRPENYIKVYKWLESVREEHHVDLFLVLENRHAPRRSDYMSKSLKETVGWKKKQLNWYDDMTHLYGKNTDLWPWNVTNVSIKYNRTRISH